MRKIFFFLLFIITTLYSNEYYVKYNSELNASIDTLQTVKIYDVDYIFFHEIKNLFSSFSYFPDREKLILKIKNNSSLIITINSNFVVYNKKLYNLSFPIITDSNDNLLLPAKEFFKFLSTTTPNFKFKDNTLTINDNINKTELDSLKWLTKNNIYTIQFFFSNNIIYESNYLNKELIINFYNTNIKDSIVTALKNTEIIKEISSQKIDENTQLKIKFYQLLPSPKIIKDENKLIITIELPQRLISKNEKHNEKVTSESLQRTNTSSSAAYIDLSKKYKKNSKFIVVIDPGHGGKDPGAIGYSGTFEKNIVLEVGKYLYKELNKYKDIKPILTRNKDIFLKLKERAEIANSNKADIFVSLHCNSAGTNKKIQKNTKGFAVYFLSPAKTDEARATAMLENEALKYEEENNLESDNDLDFIVTDVIQTKFLEESKYLGERIDYYFTNNLKLKEYGTGLDQAGFYVLKWTFMPSILLELGFITHPEEEKLLNSHNYQKKLAQNIAKAILDYKKRYYDELEK